MNSVNSDTDSQGGEAPAPEKGLVRLGKVDFQKAFDPSDAVKKEDSRLKRTRGWSTGAGRQGG